MPASAFDVISRRYLLGALGSTLMLPGHGRAQEPLDDQPGQRLRPWRPGQLDIHHIATGRGDAALIVSPSGALALIDAGAVVRADPAQVAARPDASRPAGEWIARYVARRMADVPRDRIDALAITHLHPDHVGGVDPATPWHPSRSHRLTGASDVAHRIRIAALFDPDWPDYGRTPFEDRRSAENYVAFARQFAASGGHVARLVPGSAAQLLPGQPGFAIRTLASRGRVWTPPSGSRDLFTSAGVLTPADAPRENDGSAAFLLRYGRFRWFAGGDLTDWADAGTRPWLNALTPAARAAGPVDVAVLGHHGMFDAGSADTLSALAARAWIVPAWHALHPSPEVLARLFNPRLLPGRRDVYATAMHPATAAAMPWLTDRLAAAGGHIVVRVAATGARWRVVVTSNGDETDTVMVASPWHESGPNA